MDKDEAAIRIDTLQTLLTNATSHNLKYAIDVYAEIAAAINEYNEK